MIFPDAITLARAGAITGLLWVDWLKTKNPNFERR